MAGAAKRKVSLTIDADLLDSLGASPRSLSATVNALLRLGWEEQQYQARLTALADRLYIEHGLNNPTDEAELERLTALGEKIERIAGAQAAS